MTNFWDNHIDCCGYFELEVEDEKKLAAFSYLVEKGIIDDILLDVANNNAFGSNDPCSSRLLMDLHLLIHYLYLIYRERKKDLSDGNDYGNPYYIDKYCLVEVRKRFTCRGINIIYLIYIFSLFEIYFSPDSEDGIGHMIIEGITSPINRIR